MVQLLVDGEVALTCSGEYLLNTQFEKEVQDESRTRTFTLLRSQAVILAALPMLVTWLLFFFVQVKWGTDPAMNGPQPAHTLHATPTPSVYISTATYTVTVERSPTSTSTSTTTSTITSTTTVTAQPATVYLSSTG
jgi:hypothetical protein